MCNLLLLLGDSIETNFVLYSSYEIEPAYLAVMVGFLTPVGDCEFVASFLDAVGPLSIVGAQAIYLFQPILNGIVSMDQLGALAQMLEEPEETKHFAEMIRESA